MKMTLKALRANKGWSQHQTAKALGISEDTWRNYEKGRSYPNVLVIKKMEKTFGVKFDDIIFLPSITI
ncbi:helix-turn-helix transcriptional regulator [Lactobacillus intestinalis]|uniref:helix-turn-helix transcriptional regulator n=1 Tax=Lactobacillus intestinalis TaxID=151781 RepID=UPI00272C6F0D|nr:helix-turn-helix transcriptional regulator [Lactobacillus intestinalis]